MLSDPNQTYADLAPKIWAYAGNLIVLILPTTDVEAVHNAVLVVDDLLHITESAEPVSDGGGTIYSGVVRYTTHHDKINAALGRVAEQHGLKGIVWVTGAPQFAQGTHTYEPAEEVTA